MDWDIWSKFGVPIALDVPKCQTWPNHSVANLLNSGFRFGDISQLGTSKCICRLNFENVAQSMADILLFPFSENKRPILKFYFQFPLWRFRRHRHVILRRHTKFHPIGPSAAEPWRHSDCQDGGRQSCRISCEIMVDHPQSVVDGCCFVLKFWLDRIYSFGDSAILKLSRFGLKLPIHAHF